MLDNGIAIQYGRKQVEQARIPARQVLLNAMGLEFDPFSVSFSEGEATRPWDFASIYVEPQPHLIEKLLAPRSTVLLAGYGMGKTAARLAVEYLLRNDGNPAPTLSVTYTPAVDDLIGQPEAVVLERHRSSLALNAALDLVVQFVERLEARSQAPSEQEGAIMRRLAASLPSTLQRHVLNNVLEEENNGVFWHPLRPVVRRTRVTPHWRTVLEHLRAGTTPFRQEPLAWHDLVGYAKQLGFPRIYVLVDGVDGVNVEPNALHTVIKPLLDELLRFQEQGVFLKCFLPASPLNIIIRTRYEHLLNALTVPGDVVTIRSVPAPTLKHIIAERLRRARSRRGSVRSLDWLQSDTIHESIEQTLAQHANGSPRELIILISNLLDFFCMHGLRSLGRADEFRLTQEVWKQFCHEYLPPLHASEPS